MSEATYRIGGSVAPTVCVRHQGTSVAFQCQECLDSLCEACRAPGRQNRCRICHEAIEQRLAGEPAEVVAGPPRSRWRAAIVGLTLVNVALAATWVGTILLRPVPPIVEQALAAVDVLNSVVEASRDSAGLVPTELEPLFERLPADVVERVRRGVIRYSPSADRRTFEVAVALGQRS
jgi:hypothetical protein